MIETVDGEFIPAGRIVAVHGFSQMAKPSIGEQCEIETAAGRSSVADLEMSRWINSPKQLIPAQPACVLLRYYREEDVIRRVPVIAWALTHAGDIGPVTPAGMYDGDGYGGFFALQYEDGRIHTTEGACFDTVDEYVADLLNSSRG